MSMKKIIKSNLALTIMFICASIMLSGCSTTSELPQANLAKDNLSQKGIIVVKIPARQLTVFLKKLDVHTYKDPETKLKNAYSISAISKNLFFIDNTYEQSFYSLDPGIYYISCLGQTRNYVSHQHGMQTVQTYTEYTDGAGISPDGYIKYGAFEVKAGDVLFLGNIDYIWDQKRLVNINDNLPQTKIKLLQSNSPYKSLVQNMKKAKFYQAKSRVYLDKYGSLKIK